MNTNVQNISTAISLRVNKGYSFLALSTQLFFGFLFLVVFGLKTNAQTATISVNTNSICEDATPEPIVTFTGSGGTPQYTFSYTLDNGTTQSTLVTGLSTAGSFTLNVPTGV